MQHLNFSNKVSQCIQIEKVQGICCCSQKINLATLFFFHTGTAELRREFKERTRTSLSYDRIKSCPSGTKIIKLPNISTELVPLKSSSARASANNKELLPKKDKQPMQLEDFIRR